MCVDKFSQPSNPNITVELNVTVAQIYLSLYCGCYADCWCTRSSGIDLVLLNPSIGSTRSSTTLKKNVGCVFMCHGMYTVNGKKELHIFCYNLSYCISIFSKYVEILCKQGSNSTDHHTLTLLSHTL